MTKTRISQSLRQAKTKRSSYLPLGTGLGNLPTPRAQEKIHCSQRIGRSKSPPTTSGEGQETFLSCSYTKQYTSTGQRTRNSLGPTSYLKYKAEFGYHWEKGGGGKQTRKQDLEGPDPQAQPKTESGWEESTKATSTPTTSLTHTPTHRALCSVGILLTVDNGAGKLLRAHESNNHHHWGISSPWCTAGNNGNNRAIHASLTQRQK